MVANLFNHDNLFISGLDARGVKAPSYDFGENIFGGSYEIIREFLEKERKLADVAEKSLAKQVQTYIYESDHRQKYVAMANAYLARKSISPQTDYDIVLVGAGLHAASFVYTLKKQNPELKCLIVERETTPCSMFTKFGDSLVLNSPTYSKVGLNANIVPGHFIQVSDFDELAARPFPTGKHMSELTAMLLFHADADVLYEFEVTNIEKAGDRYHLSHNGKKVGGRCVVIANGMGDPRQNSYKKDKLSEHVICADDFISRCFDDRDYYQSLKDKRIGVIGDGDTANCVMEYLLPLVYPNRLYGFYQDTPVFPQHIYWIGQSADNIQEYFYSNKQRYCHSGGIIEFFWDGDAPFDLPSDPWERAKERISYVPERLECLSHNTDAIELGAGERRIEVDLAIDCTGRMNQLSDRLLQQDYSFIEGDIVLYGGRWDEDLDKFIDAPRTLKSRKIACQAKHENIFFIGGTCPLDELINNDEARNGSFQYQEDRNSLTNSKWSLEHTLPRTIAFAQRFLASLQNARDYTHPRSGASI